jgi:hypothetical protein
MGKIGDVSGLGVEGKIGDVSGDATFDEVQALLLQNRHAEGIDCLERKVDRLQFEMLAIARWLDLRLRLIEDQTETIQQSVDNHALVLAGHEGRITNLEQGSGEVQKALRKHQERLDKVDPPPKS